MPYYQLVQPLDPATMDFMLAQGFYRMRQTLFTTVITYIDEGTVIEVLWARVKLDGYMPGKRHKELLRRNRRFALTLTNAVVNEEIENLYAAYAQSMSFDAPESATAFLLGDSPVNYFPSKMWQVRDGDMLIAAGYFDEGVASTAGILNFYHPDYKKYSPGKWLYLESVRFAAETGKTWFYPGYIAVGYPKFDYKLMAGKARTELWDIHLQEWYPYEDSVHARRNSGLE